MAHLNAKSGFRALALVGLWLLLGFIAWTMMLSGGDIKQELPRGDDIPSIRNIEEITRLCPDPKGKDCDASLQNPGHGVEAFYLSPYQVNCSAIFADDRREISRVEVMLKNERAKSRKRELSVPSDKRVSDYSQNCEFYRTVRDYPKKVLSREEEAFPLAFIILAHRNAVQFELLLRAIYQPHNVYAIHPDAKSPPDFLKAIRNLARCFDNVFICSKLEDVKYAGYSRLMADINCMQDLVKHPVRWRYLINQCGEAFPLKTNLEMVRQIRAYHGTNDVEGYDAPHKLARFHRFSPKYASVTSTKERLMKYPPPGNISLYSGNAYNTFSREFIEYALTDPLPVQFLSWINKTYSPDEHYWASLNRAPGAPGGVRKTTHTDINTSFVKWAGETFKKECVGQYVRGVCVMSTGYLPYVARQPHLFANKFHNSYDPVTLQCLQELLIQRTKDPSLTEQYFTEFPKKHSWY